MNKESGEKDTAGEEKHELDESCRCVLCKDDNLDHNFALLEASKLASFRNWRLKEASIVDWNKIKDFIRTTVDEAEKRAYEKAYKDARENQNEMIASHAAEEAVQKERERILEIVKGIDDGGGGSGRRIKIQLIGMLSAK